jgi:hypothetical protein
VSGICCILEDLISISGQRQCIRLDMSLIELGLDLMKEKQPMNFGQARSLQLGISKCLYTRHIHLCPKSWETNLMQGLWRVFCWVYATSKAYSLWHLIKNHIIVCRNILFCEDEILTITPNKEDLGEYSINDLSIQGRGRQVLIHQEEATRELAKPQNEDEGAVQ